MVRVNSRTFALRYTLCKSTRYGAQMLEPFSREMLANEQKEMQ